MNFGEIPIGIDLGTTNSCIGAFIHGKAKIIPNQNHSKLIPSIVSFDGNQIAIGDQTVNKIYKNPEKEIYSIKRIMGKNPKDKDYKDLIKNLAYKNEINIDNEGRPYIQVEFNGEKQNYYPQIISSLILKRLKQIAENFLEKEIKKVVITIPAYFTDSQREATKIAAESIGLEVLKIINEPTAAALAYGIIDKYELEDNYSFFKQKKEQKNNIKDKNILVFDLGGGTFDVTCLELRNDDNVPEFIIKGHNGYTFLGGDDFDNILVDYCIKIFEQKEYPMRQNRERIKIKRESEEGIYAINRLKLSCEKIKKILSEQESANIYLEKFYDNKDLKLEIERKLFERLCENKFNELIPPIEKALKEARFTKKDVNEILLVGGSSKIPKIKKILKSFFGNKIIINDRINPDEIVAYGATLQAAILMKEPALEDILINEICAHSVGAGIINEKREIICDTLIKKGTSIPFEMEKDYTTLFDYQEEVSIEIYEGENLYCKDNRLLDQFMLENITKAKAGIPKIMVKIKLDKDSILHVTAYEKKEDKIGSIKSIDVKYDKGILSKNEIKNMNNRLLKNEYFEKDIINKKEKDLCDEITFLFDEFENTNSLFDFIKIIEVQEKLVDIIDVDKIEKKFENVKYLFKLYNNLFANYKDYQTNKKKYLNFLEKIKKYMSIFKDVDPFYLKSLIFIFKDDKYQKRFIEILHFSILLIIDNIKSGKNNKKISFYYDEILDLINDFKKNIENSDLKEKFNSIEHESKLEREKLKFKFWPQDLTIEEANSSIDQLSYIIENVIYSSNKKSMLYEKDLGHSFLQN